jgi:hypothetical protein
VREPVNGTRWNDHRSRDGIIKNKGESLASPKDSPLLRVVVAKAFQK